MSYWTEWYIAEPSDVEKIVRGETDALQKIELDSIIQTDLDDLADLLNAEYIESMDVLNTEPMIVTVPESLVKAIADLVDDDINSTARRWTETDELGDRAELDLSALLRTLRAFCSQCLTNGKQIIERTA